MARFTIPANDVRIFVDGIEMKLMGDVTGEDIYGREKVSGIGDIKGLDLVPSEASFRVTLSGYFVKDSKLIASNIWPETVDDVLDGKMFTIEMFNKNPATMLKKWEDAAFENGNLTLVQHRQLMMRATFQALNTSGKISG